MEEKGDAIKDQVWSSNPWAGLDCERHDCLVCYTKDQGATGQDCRARGVLYENTCGLCKAKGKEVKYVTESGRSTAERSAEHYYDANSNNTNTNKTSKSHMKTHMEEEHPDSLNMDVRKVFKMKIVRQHSTPLSRELHEAIRIAREGSGGTELLNSKEEYTRCFIPNLVVEGNMGKITRPRERVDKRTLEDRAAQVNTNPKEQNRDHTDLQAPLEHEVVGLEMMSNKRRDRENETREV